MELKLNYNEMEPSLEQYNELLLKMNKMSKAYFEIDNLFKNGYGMGLMTDFESQKRKMVFDMFNEIISCFSPVLNKIPCAIYLNGSYARRSITHGSDIDLIFYFNEEDIEKCQPLVFLVRNAIATMLRVSTMHVHSFAKNFTTEYRKKNNLVIPDQDFSVEITWPTNKKYVIEYPKNQMAAEREICEMSSIKNILEIEKLYRGRLEELHPREWMYTHQLIYCNDPSFSVNDMICNLDSMYSYDDQRTALLNIEEEVRGLSQEIETYYATLLKSQNVELASFNMVGKRKVAMMFYAFMTYLRWYYKANNEPNMPITLDLVSMFNHKSSLIIPSELDNLYNTYCYFRFLISRIEMWVDAYNHHYEHRSKEIIDKNTMFGEYDEFWQSVYSPISEQEEVTMQLIKSMDEFLRRHRF